MSKNLLLPALVKKLTTFAPLHLAGSWDNVGLLVEPSERVPLSKVLLTVDLTEQVLDEAIALGSNAIISYHPPIFSAMKRMTQSDVKQRIITRAIENKIAIYSPHTTWDAIQGGINDWLADCFSENKGGPGIASSEPIQPQMYYPASATHKVAVYCPNEDGQVDRMRTALSTCGCGKFGNYSQCSWSSSGTGTFLGNESSNPAIGSPGQLESVSESKLEMLWPAGRNLKALVPTIKANHKFVSLLCVD